MKRKRKKRKFQLFKVTIAERLPAVAERLGFNVKERLDAEKQIQRRKNVSSA